VKLIEFFKKLSQSVSLVDIIFITWLSLLVHLWRITYPGSVVFDEVTFGKFLNAYAKGEYYFDLHPPLGKLLLWWAAQWGGIDPTFNYEKIGTVFTQSTYVWLRSLTALAGALVPTSVALIMRGLGFSRRVLVLAALFVIFENALTVISRTFVFDIFLLFFGFASLAFGVWAQRTKKPAFWWAAWLLAAAAFSIKWTGLSFLGVLTLWELREGWVQKNFNLALRKLVTGWTVAFVFYFIIFAIHFAATPNSGIGNDFMTAEFQSGLIGSRFHGSPDLKKPNLLSQFIELNKMMWSYQKGMNQSHPYSSRWYSWPVLGRPIYFWGKTDSVLKERIYLVGNPLLWWVSSLMVIYFIYLSWRSWRDWLVEPINGSASREFFLCFLYLVNFLPFVFIGRVMFLYHYFVALVVALMILAVVIDKIKKQFLVWLFLGGVLVSFCFFAPLTYALPLSDLEYHWRVWFPSWM
jgi:dolichyl-phosphate-mannose-protein mannosyltransferase